MSKRIKVRVSISRRGDAVSIQDDGTYKIRVNAPRQKGKANLRITEILACHFNIPKSSVKIVHGHAASDKLIELT